MGGVRVGIEVSPIDDAIHAATVQMTGCEQFLTNYARFTGLPGLTILPLSQL